MDTLEIEDRHLGGNNLEAYYLELTTFRAMAVEPQIAPERRRLWEMVANGMKHVPETVRQACGVRPPNRDGFVFFGPDGPEIVERPGADSLAIRAASEVIAEMEPGWVAAVEDAHRISDYPRVMAAWCELPLEAVLAEMMNERGIEDLVQLVERAQDAGQGVDGYMIGQRMECASTDVPGSLEPLAQTLNLNFEERMRLAKAFTYEREDWL